MTKHEYTPQQYTILCLPGHFKNMLFGKIFRSEPLSII